MRGDRSYAYATCCFDRGILVAVASILIATLSARAAENSDSSSSRPPFSAFKMVTVTNIFNARRSATYVPSPQQIVRPTRFESFALVGVMAYDKGPFAFFEGNTFDYQKVLQKDQSIAGFKIEDIEPTSVKLKSATNEIDLKIGMQMTRADQGEWKLAERPENFDGTRIAGANWTAQPAVQRPEREPQQQDGGPFQFPGGNLPDAIAQAIQGAVSQAVQLPPGAVPGQGTDQNGGRTINVAPAPTGGQATQPANGDSQDVLRRLIERRQRENQ